jgi:hypothetical protein
VLYKAVKILIWYEKYNRKETLHNSSIPISKKKSLLYQQCVSFSTGIDFLAPKDL